MTKELIYTTLTEACVPHISTHVLKRKISMKPELLVLLTYMHILHTTGNTKRECSLLDSVNLSVLLCYKKITIGYMYIVKQRRDVQTVCNMLICNVPTEITATYINKEKL